MIKIGIAARQMKNVTSITDKRKKERNNTELNKVFVRKIMDFLMNFSVGCCCCCCGFFLLLNFQIFHLVNANLQQNDNAI